MTTTPPQLDQDPEQLVPGKISDPLEHQPEHRRDDSDGGGGGTGGPPPTDRHKPGHGSGSGGDRPPWQRKLILIAILLIGTTIATLLGHLTGCATNWLMNTIDRGMSR